MRSIIQKSQALLWIVSLLTACFMTATTSAATKTYVCILADNQGQSVQQVKPCNSFLPSGKDSNGKALSRSKCYELSEVRGNISISSELSCANNRLSGAAQVVCPNGSPAPNNDSSNCTANTGVSCGDGSTDLSNCPNANGTNLNGDCNQGLQQCSLVSQYIKPFIKFLSVLVGLAVVFSIIVGGIQYASSAGDPQAVTAAKNRIRNAIIALVTYIFLFALLKFLIPGGLS